MSSNVKKTGKGIATMKQAGLIASMEKLGAIKYTGKTVKEASEYITRWKSYYYSEQQEREDAISYSHQKWLDYIGHEQL